MTVEQLAVVAILATVVSSLVSYLVSKAANRLSQKDLTLSAYSNAVNELLGLKHEFSENSEFFEEEMKLGGYEELIPDRLKGKPENFLLIARAMWRFSYIFSVIRRWEEFGLTENDRKGLEKELELWLSLPAFYEVYCSHTRKAEAHNPEFLDFLHKFYANKPCPEKVKE